MRLENLCQLRVRFSLWLSLFWFGLSLDKYCMTTKTSGEDTDDAIIIHYS